MFRIQSTARQSTYPFRQNFKNNGFTWNPDTRAWESETVDKTFLRFCDRKHLKVTDTRYSRSANYRKTFLQVHNPPYYCAYCGTRLTGKDIVIDHWIPIHKLKTGKHRRFYQHMLRIFCHSDDPNNLKNLVCSCDTCNKQKATKTRHWLIRGFFGRYHGFWIIQKFLLASVFLYAVYMLISVV